MESNRLRLMIVGVTAFGLLVLTAGEARAQVQRLGWSDVERVAGQAFEEGRGKAARERLEALDRARGAVPGAVTGLDVGLGTEFPLDGADEDVGETWLEAMVTVELGRRAAAHREALSAEREAARAEHEAARLLFLDRARAAWLQWWAAEAMRAHLEEHVAEFRAAVAPLRTAAERGELTKLDLRDIEVEEARVVVEVARQRRRAESRAARLEALLARPLALVDDLALEHDADPRTSGDPWAAVRERIGAHPALRALLARAEAERSAAEAADAASPSELRAGLTGRRERDGVVSLGVGVGLHVPFGNPSAPESERLRGEATATQWEHAWRLVELGARIDAAARRYAAGCDYWVALTEGLEERLRARSALTESALARGQVALERVIRARRDVVEALHEKLEITAELLAERARAAAMSDWLGSGLADEGRP